MTPEQLGERLGDAIADAWGDVLLEAIAKEREACAELAERWAKLAENNGMDQAAWALTDLAKAMRERGKDND